MTDWHFLLMKIRLNGNKTSDYYNLMKSHSLLLLAIEQLEKIDDLDVRKTLETIKVELEK